MFKGTEYTGTKGKIVLKYNIPMGLEVTPSLLIITATVQFARPTSGTNVRSRLAPFALNKSRGLA